MAGRVHNQESIQQANISKWAKQRAKSKIQRQFKVHKPRNQTKQENTEETLGPTRERQKRKHKAMHDNMTEDKESTLT